MATTEEILMTINAKDNATSTAKQVDGSFKSMAAGIQASMASLNNGLMNLSTGMNNMLGSITNGKTAGDLIFGTSSKAETNKVLLDMMTETEDAAKSLFDTVDKVTDSSLTSMQELIPAMNAFKAATGASDKELENVTDEMANFGAAVLAQTGSTELAQSAMMDLSKGIKGAFASLDQYGVSEDALKRTGLWSGKEDDVEGYMAAVEKVVGSTEKLMETNQGLDALIGKSFSRAGKKIGNEFLPIIKDVKRGFIDLDSELGGGLAATILVASESVDVLSQGLFTASTMINGVQDIAGAFHDVRDAIKGASNAAESFNNSLNIASNASDMAGLAGVASAGDMAKGASKTEQAVDLGIGGLTAADMLKNTKSETKDYDKLLKELKQSAKIQNELSDEMDYISSLKWTTFKSGKVLGLGSEKPNVKPGSSSTMEALYNSLKSALDEKSLKDIIKENDSARKNAAKLLEDASPAEFLLDDDILEMWEKSEMGLTDAITGHFSNFKTRFNNAFDSIKNFNFGESLQKSLKKGFGGLGDISSGIKNKFTSFGKSLLSLDLKSYITTPITKLVDGVKNINITDKFKSLDQSLFRSLDNFSFKGSFDGIKDKIKGLKDTKEIVDGVEEAAEAASTLSAVAPAAEAGAVGAEATAAATTTLSGAFTSMIVPALALAAVIMIMIPIVAVIAAEAMVFIKLLGEFMEALHFENLDLSGAIEGLKSITIGLLYVGAAMAAMTFTSIMTGLAVVTSGFMGITTPLKVAKKAIMDAANELKEFGNIKIDPSIATNLQSVSDSLGAVSKAMSSMTWTNINTGFSNWVAGVLNFSSISDGIGQAKDEIIKASSKLQEFSSLTPLPDSVAQNIQNVCNSLASVGDAMGALRSIRDGQNWDNLFGDLMNGLFGSGLDIGQALNNVKTDIYNAAQALSGWTLPEIDKGISDKIGSISSALEAISSAFETLRKMRDNGNWDNMMGGIFGGTDISGALNSIKTQLETAAQAIAGLRVGQVDPGKIEAISQIGNAIQKISEVATTISQIPPMPTNFAAGGTIGPAITAIQNAATELGKLSSITFGEGGDPSSILGSINSAITGVRDTLTNLAAGFTAPATNIGTQIVSGVQSGLSPLGGVVQSSVSSGISSATGVASSGGQNLGSQTTNGFKSTLKLADVMNAEMGYVKSAVDNGISAAKTAAQNGAKEVVEAFKAGIETGSPGAMAWATHDEMGYIKGFIEKASSPLRKSTYNLARGMVDAFGNPNLNLNNLLNDSFTGWNMDQISSIDTINSQAPPSTTNTSTVIIFNEGAMPIDARNMTSYEAKQWLILALESLGVDLPIKGM